MKKTTKKFFRKSQRKNPKIAISSRQDARRLGGFLSICHQETGSFEDYDSFHQGRSLSTPWA